MLVGIDLLVESIQHLFQIVRDVHIGSDASGHERNEGANGIKARSLVDMISNRKSETATHGGRNKKRLTDTIQSFFL